MALAYPIEPGLSWQEHYARYGFAVVRGAVNSAYIDEARQEACRLVDSPRPPEQWTVADVREAHIVQPALESPILRSVYDQPEVRAILDEALGKDMWDGRRAFQLFVSAFDPEAAPHLAESGHIDFVRCPVPVLGSGLIMQVALRDTEPFSGNITLWPGSHIEVQRRLIEDPSRQYPQDFADISGEPYEHVARAGDVLLFSHLVFHAGNVNHAAGRSPRIALHCQATREQWLEQVEAPHAGMCAWEKSLAQNGAYRVSNDERRVREAFRAAKAGKLTK